MDNCIFCMIGRKELPARIVYEDERVLAFDDIAPQAPVHVIVIPKAHYESLSSDPWNDDLCAVFAAVPKVAALKGVDKTGYRVIVNNGPDANQTIGHLHIHVLGGRAMSHGMVNFSAE